MKKAYVIGKNASKSLSPIIFNYWFKKYNIEGEYGFMEINEVDFNNIVPTILKEKDLCGLNTDFCLDEINNTVEFCEDRSATIILSATDDDEDQPLLEQVDL